MTKTSLICSTCTLICTVVCVCVCVCVVSTTSTLCHFSTAAGAPVFMTAVQENATAIRVIWFTTNPPKNTIGYRIYYRGPTNDSVDVDDALANTHVLTDLKNNESYTIFIASKSNHLPSERLVASPVFLGQLLIILCHES